MQPYNYYFLNQQRASKHCPLLLLQLCKKKKKKSFCSWLRKPKKKDVEDFSNTPLTTTLHYTIMFSHSPLQQQHQCFPLLRNNAPHFLHINVTPPPFQCTTSPCSICFTLKCSHAIATTTNYDTNDNNLWQVWGLRFKNIWKKNVSGCTR